MRYGAVPESTPSNVRVKGVEPNSVSAGQPVWLRAKDLGRLFLTRRFVVRRVVLTVDDSGTPQGAMQCKLHWPYFLPVTCWASRRPVRLSSAAHAWRRTALRPGLTHWPPDNGDASPLRLWSFPRTKVRGISKSVLCCQLELAPILGHKIAQGDIEGLRERVMNGLTDTAIPHSVERVVNRFPTDSRRFKRCC